MKRKCFIVILFLSAALEADGGGGTSWLVWVPAAGVVVAFLGLIINLLKGYFKKREKIGEDKAQKLLKKEQGKKCEKLYRKALAKELGRIGIIGPGFESIRTRIEETFISLYISPGHFEEPGAEKMALIRQAVERDLLPGEVMKKAFEKHRLLVIIGDPGSGKTTLLKHYAVTCLDKKHSLLGFNEKNVLPLFFPLRDLVFDGDTPVSLYQNLAARANKRHLPIPAEVFQSWLENRPTLVLLDGLDEIHDQEKRRRVCQWLDGMENGLHRAWFVLTSRPTGYRKLDNIEVACPHLQGVIKDFTAEQQAHFLNQWFRAVYLDELPANAGRGDREAAEQEALARAQRIIAFLNLEKNKAVCELARVPMLLQIMAITWKNRDFLPETRWELYDVSLNYLLEFRDKRRNLNPVLPADKARVVLAPTALRLLEEEREDNAPKESIHAFMQEILDTFDQRTDAREFCKNLRDRAGVIADYGAGNYIFRHKSFMEFLAAIELRDQVLKNPARVGNLAAYFPDPWWEETLRFFMARADVDTFDRWMRRFFDSEISRELDTNQQTLLQLLVKEARQRKIDSLKEYIYADGFSDKQKRYMIDCLKTIGSAEAAAVLANFVEKGRGDQVNLGLARDAVAELSEEYVLVITPGSLRSPFEDNVEYILIPGGTYRFSVSKKEETVEDIYFCKYPVTNKRYRKFISYLAGKQKDIEKKLPLKEFAEKLSAFAKTIKGYPDYLGKDFTTWKDTLRSRYDDEKGFNGDDQPVVGVSWYMARAYCFWLSCLQGQENAYRLPTELEWEWAAAGREPDGSLREYPWAKDKGEPTPELANYDGKVGATTPVDRYPGGATPEGLMDMAGNVWEWMENWYDDRKKYRSLRGGSWNVPSDYLRCASRCYVSPAYDWIGIGFRVVSLCSPSHT